MEYKYEDLENGKVAEKAIHQFSTDQNEQNLFELLNILRDSTVLIPLISPELSQEEMEKVMSLKEGDEIMFDRDLHFKVDSFKNADGIMFHPAFTSEEQIPEEYRNRVSIISEPLIQVVMDIFYNEFYQGLVINPLTENFVVDRDRYFLLSSQRGIVMNKEDKDPLINYFNQGIDYYNEDTPEGYKMAEKIFLELSPMGYPDADLNLGYIYMYGKVGEIDRKKGFGYFNKAAQAGNLSAIIKVADDLITGEFNKKNEKEAFNLYMAVMLETHRTKAYRSEGCVFLRLAKCYDEGIGCPKNPYDAYAMADAAYHIFKDNSDLWYYASQVEAAKELSERCYQESISDLTIRSLEELKQYRNITVYMNYRCDQEFEGSMISVHTDPNGKVHYQLTGPVNCNEKGLYFSKNSSFQPRELSEEEIQNCYYIDIRGRLQQIQQRSK